MNDGGPAFPGEGQHDQFGANPEFGMSLRDWLAGQALNGFLANPAADVEGNDTDSDADLVAKGMYAFADAMLKERDK